MASLSILVPVYNEINTLKNVIDECLNVMLKSKIDFEIVVINDGSFDGSEKVETTYGDIFPITFVNHLSNLGYGEAIKSGIKRAQKEWIIIVPSDGQFKIAEVIRLWDLRESGYIICGKRLSRRDPLFRKLISKIFNIFISFLHGTEVKDVGWIKMYENLFIKNISIQTSGFVVDTEILLQARYKKMKIKNVDLSHEPRHYGNSKITFSECIKVFKEIYKILKIKYEFKQLSRKIK